MTSRVFRGMGRVFLKTFGSPSSALWQRHDAEDAVPIKVIFHRAYAEVTTDGIRVDAAAPTAWIRMADAQALAAGRTDPDLVFDNDDTLTIESTDYAVESCRFDGHQMVEVRLSKRSS